MLKISAWFFTTSYSLTTCSLFHSFVQKSQLFSFSMLFPFYKLYHKCSDASSVVRSLFFLFFDHFLSCHAVFTFPVWNILNYVATIYCMLRIVSSNCLSITYSSIYLFLYFSHFSTFVFPSFFSLSTFSFLFLVFLLFLIFILFISFNSLYIQYVQVYFLHCNY
jgi:hypothetical protein